MTDTTTTSTTTSTEGVTPTAPAGQATGQASTEGVTPPAPAANDLPDWAKDPATALKMVNDLRAENARDRTAAKDKAAADAKADLLKQLGLAPAENKPIDAAEVARDLAAKDQRIRDLQTQSALTDALSDAGAKPKLARAAILGDGILADLDPSSATFSTDVATRVATYIGNNPELKAAGPVPRASGTDTPGGDQQKPTYTRAQLRDFEFYQANKKDIDLASTEGRIV